METPFKPRQYIFYYSKEHGTIPGKVITVYNKLLKVNFNGYVANVHKSKCVLQSVIAKQNA